jgi:hypothetical protein
MVSRNFIFRVLEAIILETRHSLFQLPELLSRLLQGAESRRIKSWRESGNTGGTPMIP